MDIIWWIIMDGWWVIMGYCDVYMQYHTRVHVKKNIDGWLPYPKWLEIFVNNPVYKFKKMQYVLENIGMVYANGFPYGNQHRRLEFLEL